MKKWAILNKLKIKNILRTLLVNRGIKTKKEIEEFLNPPSPYTLTVSDLGISSEEINKAIKRIKRAIKSGEKIIVYGDYDADGVCATAILWETLHKLGANVMPFIPTREEGYGMKVERIDEFAKDGVSLIITVDQGIVALRQVEHAKKIGIEVIVTDHHLPGKEKPKTCALVHTTKLSGSGTSWFLATKLAKPGLDLVTIGTVADVMPLVNANRAIVKYGILEVQKTKRLGLLELCRTVGIDPKNIGTYEIGFMIGPRLNAAGRMEDPIESLRLVCTKDNKRAMFLAQRLDEKNRQRKQLMDRTLFHARDLWLKEDGKSNLIFVAHESYEEGIIGLVAGKLMEEFYRPAIIVARGEKYSRASARSINGFNIVEAIRTCVDILGPHGGHALAAGFTVETEKLEEVKRRLVSLSQESLDKERLQPELKIDMEINLSDLSLELYEKLQKLEPFGMGNPQPMFLTRDLAIVDAHLVGGDSQHLKLRLLEESSKRTMEAIGFGLGKYFPKLSPEEKVDLVYNLISDQWNGEKKLQLKIKDLRVSDGERI